MDLVDQPGVEVLANGGNAAAESNILAQGHLLCALYRGMDAIGDEVKGRSALHRDGATSVMRKHEDRDVIGGILAPPSLPTLIAPRAPHWPEHVTAHDPGANVLEATRGEVVVDAFSADLVTDQRSSEVRGRLLERRRAEDPIVQRHTSRSHGVVQVLVETGAVTIDRDSE